ncbi:MAG: hypothetical protein U0325_01760 [Polyangiales bacterium]
MIEVGESLGNRYRVANAPEALRPGVVFEVADRSGATVLGQVLADGAVPPSMVQEVRGDLSVIPAMPTVLKPREIALSAAGVPVGVLERPGLARLRDRLQGLDAEQKKTVATALLRAFATLASDIAMLHQSGQLHGAISSGVMLGPATGEITGALLSGFGVVSFARRLGKLTAPPTPRGDLVDLLGALHDLFVVAGVQPDGGAAAKWTLLRHAAMHGEHPALASGNALATQLNELAAMPAADERAPRPSRMPTIGAPMRPRNSVLPSEPSAGASATVRPPAGNPTRKTIPPSGKGSVRAEPPRMKRWNFSAGILVGGLGVIALCGSAAAYYIWDARAHRGDARLMQPRVRITRPACAGETPQTATALTLGVAAPQFDATCADGRLVVVSREGTNLVVAQRAARRGQAFAAPLRLGDSVVELGAPITLDTATWVSWRNGVGAPFGVARVDAAAAAPRTVPISGWDNVAVQGVALLHATPRTAWIATTIVGETRAHGVLIESTTGDHPRVRTWFLGEGRVASSIPGPRPTLLLDLASDTSHSVAAVTLDLAAIEALPGNDRTTSAHGGTIPDSALTTSAPLRVEGDRLVAPRQGVVTTAGVRVFGVMTGAARPEDACEEAARCVGPGAVRLATFPAAGAGALTEIAPRAWLEDLRAEGGEVVEVSMRTPDPADTPMSARRMVSHPIGGAPGAARIFDAEGSARARLLRCGDETWFVHDTPAPHRVAATPAACADRLRTR